MGFRLRKSVKFGPARINISKSGIGYSVGTKGYRVTKTAKGTIRKTATIPGTGISFVEEHKEKSKNNGVSTHIKEQPQKTKEEKIGLTVVVIVAILFLFLGVVETILAAIGLFLLGLFIYLKINKNKENAFSQADIDELHRHLANIDVYQNVANTSNDPFAVKCALDELLNSIDFITAYKEEDLNIAGMTKETLEEQKSLITENYDIIIHQAEERLKETTCN